MRYSIVVSGYQDSEVQCSCVRDIRTVRYSVVVSGISGQ